MMCSEISHAYSFSGSQSSEGRRGCLLSVLIISGVPIAV